MEKSKFVTDKNVAARFSECELDDNDSLISWWNGRRWARRCRRRQTPAARGGARRARLYGVSSRDNDVEPMRRPLTGGCGHKMLRGCPKKPGTARRGCRLAARRGGVSVGP